MPRPKKTAEILRIWTTDTGRLVMRNLRLRLFVPLLLIASSPAFAHQLRKVVINQDCSGPGGSNMQTLLPLIQPPKGEGLAIPVVSETNGATKRSRILCDCWSSLAAP